VVALDTKPKLTLDLWNRKRAMRPSQFHRKTLFSRRTNLSIIKDFHIHWASLVKTDLIPLLMHVLNVEPYKLLIHIPTGTIVQIYTMIINVENAVVEKLICYTVMIVIMMITVNIVLILSMSP
jgi:hypothetical protein